ncbi:MAG: V-type ATP synthase subunit D [Firmicutes bacterium]|nr:V-type ATP synthase subunit D [Bacillota bacterium]
MATVQNINPTRMELQRQKSRMRTAKRGHKLLKDKSDEMIRHFMMIARQNKALREELDDKIVAALRMFITARTQMTSQEIEAAVSTSTAKIAVTPSVNNIMGLRVPKIELDEEQNSEGHSILKTSAAFDASISSLTKLMKKLFQLAEIEKACDMLALEIMKIRRRINALEFILMPQIEVNIRFIRLKLAENERGQLVRVMKVKAQMEAAGQ